MNDGSNASRVEQDRQYLAEARQRGTRATLAAFVRMSGPGWLQSAITLGGGTLASSLILGVLAGVTLLWVQPLAMLFGIVMLAAIGYVTMSTGERPFAAINRHVSPVLGWGWLLASLAANMFWCLPQYALATGVMQENLLPDLMGPNGAINAAFGGPEAGWLGQNAAKVVIAVVILLVSTTITWAYGSAGWGIRVYEWLLKALVGGIVVSFFAVTFAISSELDWGAILSGFVPSWDSLNQPSPRLQAILQKSVNTEFWRTEIVSQQHDVVISAAATAVGINMTFLFPYSILNKGWTREFRGLSIFDLATGMMIPFVLATTCVVVAAAAQMHAQPVAGFVGTLGPDGQAAAPDTKSRESYYSALAKLWVKKYGGQEPADGELLDNPSLLAELDTLPQADRQLAAMLVERNAFDLARALAPLAGRGVANIVFGLGVLGMALSTITLLMLISGFCICEALGLPSRGWPHRLGTLAAATGALGPFIWGRANFYLAVYVSAFGLMLLPIAYFSFFFLMNRPALLGNQMPRGASRWCWNLLMLSATTIATLASLYTIHKKLGMAGVGAMVAFVAVVLGWRLLWPTRPAPT